MDPQGRPPQRSGDAADPLSNPDVGTVGRADESYRPSSAGSSLPSSPGERARASFPSPLSPSEASYLGDSAELSEARSFNTPGVLAPGSQFGVYLIGACIGEGGMARIYQAEHAGLRRQVAIKLLIDGFARDAEGRERFLREARIAAAIKHPNVVNIFDVGLQDEIPYLVMELLEGQDLEKLLEATGALDEAMIVDIMVPVVAGLVAVHDTGIVHRDLKPGNIFLARGHHDELEPKLLDFGISTAPGPEQLKLTINQTLMGTPFYISPEGMLGREMTPLSDQYSLGVVMYECATGCTPFTGANLSDLSRLITSGQYTPLSTRKPEVSRRLARIIERAMSVDPDKRYKDLRELGRELLTLAGQRTRMTWGLSFGDVKPTLPSRPAGYMPGGASSAPPPPRGGWRKPSVLAAALAPLLVVLIAVLLWRSRGSDHGDNTDSAPHEVILRQSERRLEPTATDNLPDDTQGRANGPAESNNRPSSPKAQPAPAPPVVEPKDALPRAPRSTSTGADVAPPRRMQRSAPSKLAGEAEPDWAVPMQSARPDPVKSATVGANGAPIFD